MKEQMAVKKGASAPSSVVKNEPVSPAQAAAPAHAPIPEWVNDMPGDAHLLLMELTIQFCLATARADGPVTVQERRPYPTPCKSTLRLRPGLLNRAESLCTHYESAAIGLDHCLGLVKEKFTAAHRTALVDFAGQIIAASGDRAPPG